MLVPYSISVGTNLPISTSINCFFNFPFKKLYFLVKNAKTTKDDNTVPRIYNTVKFTGLKIRIKTQFAMNLP